jgi:hypothetical protein
MKEIYVDSPFKLGNSQLQIFATFDKKMLILYVYFPHDYNSPWRELIKKQNEYLQIEKWNKRKLDNIAYLDFVWNKKNRDDHDKKEKLIQELDLKSFPYLDHLYVYGYDYSEKHAKAISSEEKQSVKGLGKFLLCTAISIGLEHGYITIDQPIVILPDGGYCRDPEKYLREYPTFNEIVRYYKSFGTREMDEYVQYITGRYNRELSEDDLDDIMLNRENAGNMNTEITDADKIEELKKFKELDLGGWRKEICTDNYVLLLNDYYSKNYGFEKINPEEHKGGKYYMISTIANIAGVCNLT